MPRVGDSVGVGLPTAARVGEERLDLLLARRRPICSKCRLGYQVEAAGDGVAWVYAAGDIDWLL